MRIVFPLRLERHFGTLAWDLNAVLEFDGERLVPDAVNPPPMPGWHLGNHVDQLVDHRQNMLNALDTLFETF